jgi:hypothetical protein
MADEYPAGYPTPPASPAKDLPAPAKAKPLTARATGNNTGERSNIGLNVESLATDTSGPISNVAGVTKNLGQQVDTRYAKERKLNAAKDAVWKKPYTTGRSLSK